MSSSIMLMIRTTGLFTLLAALSSASSVQVPAAVSNFQYSSSATQIFFTWSVSNTSYPPDYYIIRYSLLQKRACPSPEPNVIQHETIINTTNNEFVLMGLEAYSTYSIAFVAVNDAGEGEALERTILTRHGTPPTVTGLRVNTSITDPTSVGFIWDALTCRNTGGVFGYYFARLYENGVTATRSSTVRASPAFRKYIDFIDQSSVSFDDLQPCTMYEILLTTAINTASPGATYPMYVSGDTARASGLTGLTLPEEVSDFQYSPSTTQIFFTWSVPTTSCPPDYYIIRYSLIQKRACPSPEPNVIQHETITNTTNNEFNLVGLEVYSTYRIAFVASNDAGEGEAVERTIFTQHGTPPAVTGLRVDTSITDPTSIGFTWDALTCRNTSGVFGYYYARIYEVGQARESTPLWKYIDFKDQSSVSFDGLKPCTMYELVLTTTINTASPGATHPVYVAGDASRASGLTGLTLSDVRVEASSPRDSSMVIRWSVPARCNVSYYSLEYQLIEYLACPGDPIPEAPVSTLNVIGSYNILSGLEPFSSYRVAITGIINGARNTPVVVTGPSTESAPAALSSVSYTAEAHTLHFTWDALPCGDQHGELDGYEYNLYDTLTRSYVGSSRETTRATLLTIDGLNACSDYRFQVQVVLQSGHRSGWTTLMARTNISAPGQPQITSLVSHRDEAGTTGLTVSWAAPNTNSNLCQPTTYEIKYRLLQLGMCEDASEAPKERAGLVPGSNLTFEIPNLHPNSRYSVLVRGNTSAGYGPRDSQEQTTGYATPSALSSVSYTAEAHTLHFTWAALPCEDLHGELDGYEYDLYNTITRSYVGSSSKMTQATRLTIDGLNACSDYHFRVRVVLQSGHRSDWTTLMARTNTSAPPAVTGLGVNTSITDPTSIGFIWDALTFSSTGGVFGYYYARIYEHGQVHGSPSFRKYIDYIDQSSVLFADLQPCTMYELLLTASINTAPPSASHPVYVSGDVSKTSGLTGLTLTDVRVKASSTRDSSMVVRWSVPARCNVSYYSLEYQLIEYLACPGDPIPEAPVSTSNVTGSYNILSGLEPFSSYRVSITGIINGARNTPVVATGPTSFSAPSALSSVSYTAEAHTLHFTWDALPCEDLHGELYGYEYNLYDILTNRYFGSSSVMTRATRLTIGGLKACSYYRFQIRVVLLSGHRSDWTTLMARTNISSPGHPQISGLVPHRDDTGATGLRVSWAALNVNSNACQPTAYEIHYRLLQVDMCEDVPDAFKKRAGVVPGSTLTFDLPNLLPNSRYSVHIRGNTSAGYGPEDSMQQTTGYATPTGVPTNVQASTVKKCSLTFTWEEPPCGERRGPITGYDLVLYDATSGAEVGRSNISSASALEASFPDLIPFYNYSVKIRARNYALNGPYGPRITQQTREESLV